MGVGNHTENGEEDGVAAVLVSLGSNVDAEANLGRALDLLGQRVRVVAVSRVFRTAPAAGASGPPFLNAAVWIETDLAPADLKRGVLRPIEAALGRVRSEDKNAPRPIDLDIALWDGGVVEDAAESLVVPDPDILRWPHVAVPLADVAPLWVHPVDGRTLAAIAAGLGGSGGVG